MLTCHQCFRVGCSTDTPYGDLFCTEDWRRLPRFVRTLLVSLRGQETGKKWQVTAAEAIAYLKGRDLQESLARAVPVTLASGNGLLARIADKLLGRKSAQECVFVVTPEAPEQPVVDGDRVYVRDLEQLRLLVLASK